MRKTKIVCTIGPSSESPEMLAKLMEGGMNVARLNFSHGDFEEHGARIRNIREVAQRLNKTVAILLDTKGPEIRTGNLREDSVELIEGNTIVLTTEEILGDASRVSVSYKQLPQDVHIGSRILVDDGLIELRVTDIRDADIVCQIVNGGILKSKKGVNVPGVKISLPGITEKDAADIMFGIENGVDFIAASFVRKASDVLEIRELLNRHNAHHIQIISKIENQEGVDNLDEILDVSDGLMVARGDLGVEIPAEEVPLVQKKMILKCNLAGKPVITATQMLDSMQRNPRPTRAEASDIANAIFDGTDAIMLSGETAAGKYPYESVVTMSRIAEKAESALAYREIFKKLSVAQQPTITEAISQAVASSALDLDAKAIITSTESGYTARMVSKYRPKAPIIAVTPVEHVMRRLCLVWGVIPVQGVDAKNTDEMFQIALDSAAKSGHIQLGDLVIITAGVPVGRSGTTNLIKIHHFGEMIAKGQGVGSSSAIGHIVVAHSAKEALEKLNLVEDDILVTAATDDSYLPALRKAKALITQTEEATSHAAMISSQLGIPVIIGVENALQVLTDGMKAAVYAELGIIASDTGKVW